MKKFEIIVSGTHEEDIGKDILEGIYAAIQKYGYTDVSVKADTVKDVTKGELQLPGFLQSYQRGKLEQQIIAEGR